MGFSKFAVFALLMLAASGVIDAKYQPITTGPIMSEELLKAEVKALASLREIERSVIASKLMQKLIRTEDKCSPPGAACGRSEDCCSGACVPHPFMFIIVCQ
ncbi:hypothetical protein SOVF_114670 [Spinacia oleracea]|nr:hypothetical protein SOVF_114670 [Spinacia oleracea]